MAIGRASHASILIIKQAQTCQSRRSRGDKGMSRLCEGRISANDTSGVRLAPRTWLSIVPPSSSLSIAAPKEAPGADCCDPSRPVMPLLFARFSSRFSLADLYLLLFTTTTKLIRLESVLGFELCTTMLGNEALGHVGKDFLDHILKPLCSIRRRDEGCAIRSVQDR